MINALTATDLGPKLELRFASFNLCNLALPGAKTYANLEPYSQAAYDAKVAWSARQLDKIDADVVGFQEVFAMDALRDVLARSERFRSAELLGFDPAPDAESLTPSVALASRLPVVGEACQHRAFPRGLSVPVPCSDQTSTRFSRPVLHAQVRAPNGMALHVFVLHMKSKLPHFLPGESEDDPHQSATASLRSLVRRGAEALGLRTLLTDLAPEAGRPPPLVVLGDFNDAADSVTTQIVMGVGAHGSGGFERRLFDCHRIKARRDPLRDVGFSHLHEGRHETIDHILVSSHFNQAIPDALGAVQELVYLNEHLALRLPEASDHGQVVAHLTLG